jgi:2-dehydropantoate 2-reductase
MKIGVVGIGAVGGYFGAKLALGGHDVTFIGREQSADFYKENGLKIKSFKGDFELKNMKVFHDFRHIKDADYLFLCVKSYNTREIAEALKKRISEKTVIISVQNGVDNEEILSDIFGKERVLGSVVYISVSSPKNGIINHTAYGKILVGELDGKITERTRTLETAFLNSGVPCGISSDIKKDLWKKLMLNIAYNGFTALIGRPLEKLEEVEEAKEAFWDTLKEVQKVANADGIKITDKDVEESFNVTQSEGFKTFKTSTLQDIEAGKPLEIDSLQGMVVRTAKKYKIDIPMNKLLYALLKLK